MIQSKVSQLAIEKGFQNIQQFALQARLHWPVAAKIWNGNISRTPLVTLIKAANTLDCQIEDLFISPENNGAN